MIILDCEQGSEEWREARLGVVTASNASKIVTPTGRMSSSAAAYMHDLLAEWFTGDPQDEWQGNYWTDRGNVMEAEAFAYFKVFAEVRAERVGFIYRDESRLIGCSPDGLVGETAGLELKCPKAGTHLGWLAAGVCPSKYVPQVQFSMYVTGRRRWWFMSYYPSLPPLLVSVAPDPNFQAALLRCIPQFVEDMEEAKRVLMEDYGIEPWETVRHRPIENQA